MKKSAKLKEADEAKEKKEKEMKAAKEAEEKEAGEEGVGDPEDKAGGEDHADADKDKELIKNMVSEIIGKDADKAEREAMESLAKEAYEGHKEMCKEAGEDEKEAEERAKHSLKLARHMASKQAEADKAKESKEADEAKEKEADETKEAADDKGDEEKDADKDADKKESDREKSLAKKLLETQGRLAAVEAKLSKGEVEKYVETKLADSKQPRSVTKKFREAAGEIKSTKDFDTKWALFTEGIKNSRVELDWGILQEKSVVTETKETEGRKGLDFSIEE